MPFKFIFVLTLSMFFSLFLTAQERTHNLGIRLSGLNDFDFIYKKSDDGKKFKRYRLAGLNIGGNTVDDTQFRFNLAYAQGVEKRVSIANNFMFIHGFEPGFSFALDINNGDYIVNGNVFLGYVLGFQYNISSAFYINVETIPSFIVGYQSSDLGGDVLFANAGFNSNEIALTLAYVFNTSKK